MENSPTGWATDGGFPFQIDNVAANVDELILVVPEIKKENKSGSIFITSPKIKFYPISKPPGRGIWRKIFFPFWFLYYLPLFIKLTLKTDFIHPIIPGDVGTVGIFMSHLTGKPMLLRYSGNWYKTKTLAEKMWKKYMEKYASPKRIILATGGGKKPPSTNKNIYWIFSTSISETEILSKPRKNYGLLQKKTNLIHIGRQTESKGTDLIIRSIKELSKKYKISLQVIGDGDFLPYLKNLAKKLQIENHILFTGKLTHEEIIKELRKTDILVFPSKTEGFPKVVMEAMSQGNVVISTGVSVLKDLIPESHAGFILEERSPEEITKHVEYLINHPNKFVEMAAHAIEFSKNYTLEQWRKEINKYIKMLHFK